MSSPWSAQATKAVLGASAAYVGFKIADKRLHLADDIAAMKDLAPVGKQMAAWASSKGLTVADIWAETVQKFPKKPCVIDADQDVVVSFAEMDELSNRLAHWAASRFKPDECCAVDMENRLEYCIAWIGLAKAGVHAALINNNIKGKALVHSIGVSNAAGLIFGTEVTENVADVAAQLKEKGVRVLASYGAGGTGGTAKAPCADDSLDELLPASPTGPVSKAERRKNGSITTTFGYIYTSGTTGLPKACRISHMKLLNYGMVGSFYKVTEDDTVYGSGLPLYHTSGHLGWMHTVRCGGTLIVRRKFSAKKQWEDCAKYKATGMQYIGELCRYLLNTPKRPEETAHRVRVAFGNGLRPEIWNEFQRRFNIPEIGEFYGATEGNSGTFNHCVNFKGQGAVGRAGWLMRKARPMIIVKFDVAKEQPVRGPSGFCVECANNEPGELLSPIKVLQTADGPKEDFEGYTDKSASEKKVLRNVFKQGDAYFRTGDLLRRDGQYFYFVDRIGDTFRWKGENVSTMEVSEVVSSFPGVGEANVYGVEVPGKDGRACAVALTLQEGAEIDPEKFGTYCKKELPGYAIPLIIRFTAAAELTGTFKHKKGDYKNEGMDPAKLPEKMWWFNPAKKAFEPFGPDEYASITAGKAKL